MTTFSLSPSQPRSNPSQSFPLYPSHNPASRTKHPNKSHKPGRDLAACQIYNQNGVTWVTSSTTSPSPPAASSRPQVSEGERKDRPQQISPALAGSQLTPTSEILFEALAVVTPTRQEASRSYVRAFMQSPYRDQSEPPMTTKSKSRGEGANCKSRRYLF